jgi:ABC-type transporter Mla subunit MlaD
MSTELLQKMSQQIQQINQSLEGTISHLDALNRKIEDSFKNFMENLTAVSENMRLIVEVIKKQRANTKEDLEDIKKNITEQVEKLWKEKSLETITKQELQAIEKIKTINSSVSENLYMTQLLSIIQSLREVVSRAVVVKSKKDEAY